MNLIALILGLTIERLATHLLKLREPRWFDPYFDWGSRHLWKLSGVPAYVGAVVLVLLPAIPILLIMLAFKGFLFGLPYLAFAVLVLLFSLGPRDLGEEVDEYCRALDADDLTKAALFAKELMEKDMPSDEEARRQALQDAIFVQANNRIFAVVFWFIVVGPVGAWIFRVADLMRRRAAFESNRLDEEQQGDTARQYEVIVRRIHGVLAWMPARLLALGYAVAGSFEDAVSGWRGYYENAANQFFTVTEGVVAATGGGALHSGDDVSEVDAARGALSLVMRTLFVWVFFIAVMTLAGWAT